MVTIDERLRQWQQELLDLTNRNRLLNFRFSASRPSSLQLIAPHIEELYALLQAKCVPIIGNDPPEEKEGSGESQNDLVVPHTGSTNEEEPPAESESPTGNYSDGLTATPLPIKPGTALSSMPSDRTNRVALRLLTRARASEQEQGINILFAAFGLIKWQEKPGEEIWRYAPLVMLPLKIEERVREGRFCIVAAGEDPEFNQTLAERLKRDFGLVLDVEMDEDISLAAVFAQIRQAVGNREGWEILEQAHVGMFQFHKLRMFTDLAEHADVASRHPIVQALGLDGVTIAPLPEGIPSEEELDHAVPPQDSFTILDADASQLRAIQAATRGGHLIIQGPPGTGKSQTIANIIAECIATGRNVLFVSEKAAAMEVVHRRLTEHGLGDFCLMLHSQKANKRDVIHNLGACLQPGLPPASSSQEELHLRRLQEMRIQLNSYSEALHRTREPLGESAFWAHGQLAALHDVPYLSALPPSLDQLTHERLEAWEERLTEVARQAEVLAEGSSHPWAGISATALTPAARERLRHTLSSLNDALVQIQTEAPLLAAQLKLPVPVTMQDVRNLAHIAGNIPDDGDLNPGWFDPSRIQQTEALAREAAAHAVTIRDPAERLFAAFRDDVLRAATPEVIATYERGRLARLFSLSHRRFRAQVRSAAKDGLQRSTADELSYLRDARQINQHLAWFREHDAQLTKSVGITLGNAMVPDANVLTRKASNIAAVSEILARLWIEPPPTEFVEEVCRAGTRARIAPLCQRLDELIDRIDGGLATLQTFFEPEALQSDGLPLSDARLDALSTWLGLHLSRFDDLYRYLHAKDALEQAKSHGLKQVVDELFAEGVSSEPPELWARTFRRLILTYWLDQVYRNDETLRTFRGEEHEATVARFRDLDRWYINTTEHRIRRILASRRARVSADYGGEPGLLRFEAAKRKRHMPLRRLFERIPNLLPTLKPCLMMSPLSVAQFLPADRYQFHVVIFDEASQIRPCDAIGAIMRGNQLVVAGDSQQLPPTTFFDRTVDDGEFDEDMDVLALESILKGLEVKQMPSERLLWHYRSRHEDLIAYSNHHFYDRKLITFPSPAAKRTPTRGVRLEYVPNARYEDERDRVLKTPMRVNREEARRVAALVIAHARARPEESLGVVALGFQQRDVVDEEIKQAQLLDRSLDDFFRPDKHEPFFVKALEQVQGDERDVIMISVGYGKNALGTLSHNFGPINKEGGERRLNVLVTRARHQVLLVSSIRAADIALEKTRNRGPRLLKNYLDFAERGPIALDAETTVGNGEYESPFEMAVGEALQRAGFTVHRQVGCSKYRIDLGIVHPWQPGRFILGVECDGATYHRSKTARDRDRLRQEVLENLGWTIHRVWSTEWIRQPDRELDQVIAHVNQSLEEEERGSDVAAPWEPIVEERDHADAVPVNLSPAIPTQDKREELVVEIPDASEDLNGGVVPYRVAELSVAGSGDIYSVPLRFIVDAVASCVEVEGPIHVDLLARRIAAAWGYQRAGARIRARIDTAVSDAVLQKRVRRKGTFLWPSTQTAVVPRSPTPDGIDRDIAHIPHEEIVRGMAIVLAHALSLTEDELVERTARLFGFQRTGRAIERRLRDEIRLAREQGILEAKNTRYQLLHLPADLE